MTLEKEQSAQQNTGIEKLAAGWYVAALSRQLRKDPMAIQLFGEDLVLWRDNSGQPVLMDRYCCHQGASLAHGSKIVNGCIECPFHKWQFNAQGRCVVAPDVEHIPQTAQQRIFPTQERYNYIWAWFGTPEPLFPLPEFAPAEADRREYMPLHFTFHAKTSASKVIENAYDNQHFISVHGLQSQSFPSQVNSTQVEDYQMSAFMEAKTERYVGVLGSVAKLLGLNVEKASLQVETLGTVHLVTMRLNNEIKLISMLSASPISEKQTDQHFFLCVKKTGKLSRNLLYYVLFGLQSAQSASQDVKIWNNMKTDGGGGVYVKNDRGVLEYRKLYQKLMFGWGETKRD